MANTLDIVVCNVEHGAAIYVNTPNQRSILLDAGSSGKFSPAAWLNAQYKLSSVDLFLLSHADADHISDIQNVDCLLHPQVFYRNTHAPLNLMYPSFPPTTNPLMYYREFDARYNQPLSPDSPFQLQPEENWGGVKIKTFCNAESDLKSATLNDYSMVTFLLYGNLEFIFPGDLEAPGWDKLLERDEFRRLCTPSSLNKNEIRILVAAHHGRKAGVHKRFLDLYEPHLSIISDKYGVEHTDYRTYYEASSGFSVYDSTQRAYENRYVLSTKMNDFVRVSADSTGVCVVI